MNNNKICFITCVNDDTLYNESLKYIEDLNIPVGYEIEFRGVKDAKSMTSGYNEAMKRSDAKYKVYLHQDTFIINKNFIYDMLEVFNSSDKIGMIGLAGAKVIPANGVWWESEHTYGKVHENHTGNMNLLAFNEVINIYEEVKAIDGLIMITQYDIPWREETFDGWHFYDVSQSVEFTMAGYKVVVPKQEEIWCIHDCGPVNTGKEYEKYRNVFLDEYSTKIYPLVSILIPTYNQTKYLREALESAINQTYPNIEIIIGDDSTNDEVENFIKLYLKKNNNIIYFKNQPHEMDYGWENTKKLYNKSNGEYINYLFHDDVFVPTKIEKMMNYFLQYPNITLVTSVRQQITENGDKIELNGPFKRLFNKDTIVNGYEMNRYIVSNLINCIGEPTTVLFKKRYINNGEFGHLNKKLFKCNVDVAIWVTLLGYGDMVYISEVLSYFRCHSQQNSNKPELFLEGIIDWYNLIVESYKMAIIKNNKEYKALLYKWLITFFPNLIEMTNRNTMIENEIKNIYHQAINELLENTIINKLCPICNNKVEKFLPYAYKQHTSDFTYKYNIIGSDEENFSCPHCYSHDRERHLVKYFDKLEIWDKYIIEKKVLHIAPESHIQKIISSLDTKEYICGDLYPTNNSIIKMNIKYIQFEDNYFDFIICNHVLEHISEDFKAMEELYRVLKKGGHAVLQAPYSLNIDKSFEDNSINTDELRKKYFGQSDHVRIYGKDYFDKIKAAGFTLKIVKNDDLFTQEESKKYGFNSRENLILVCKDS